MGALSMLLRDPTALPYLLQVKVWACRPRLQAAPLTLLDALRGAHS